MNTLVFFMVIVVACAVPIVFSLQLNSPELTLGDVPDKPWSHVVCNALFCGVVHRIRVFIYRCTSFRTNICSILLKKKSRNIILCTYVQYTACIRVETWPRS